MDNTELVRCQLLRLNFSLPKNKIMDTVRVFGSEQVHLKNFTHWERLQS